MHYQRMVTCVGARRRRRGWFWILPITNGPVEVSTVWIDHFEFVLRRAPRYQLPRAIRRRPRQTRPPRKQHVASIHLSSSLFTAAPTRLRMARSCSASSLTRRARGETLIISAPCSDRFARRMLAVPAQSPRDQRSPPCRPLTSATFNPPAAHSTSQVEAECCRVVIGVMTAESARRKSPGFVPGTGPDLVGVVLVCSPFWFSAETTVFIWLPSSSDSASDARHRSGARSSAWLVRDRPPNPACRRRGGASPWGSLVLRGVLAVLSLLVVIRRGRRGPATASTPPVAVYGQEFQASPLEKCDFEGESRPFSRAVQRNKTLHGEEARSAAATIHRPDRGPPSFRPGAAASRLAG